MIETGELEKNGWVFEKQVRVFTEMSGEAKQEWITHCWRILLKTEKKMLKISWLTQHNHFREKLRKIKRNWVISG